MKLVLGFSERNEKEKRITATAKIRSELVGSEKRLGALIRN